MRKVYGIILGILILVAALGLGIKNFINQPAQLWDGEVYISDFAELLTGDEEKKLREVMENVSQYGNVVLVCAYTNMSDSEGYAYDYYTGLYGTEPGVILLIDMTNRYIYMHTLDSVEKVIARNKALVITDNVYRYASAGNYYQSARVAFEQVFETLEGRKIPENMKYIINGCLAMVISLLVNYILVATGKHKKRNEVEIVEGTKVRYCIENPALKVIHSSTIESSGGSSGGFGSRSSSGGRSSGSSSRSGSGGGHRF